MPNPKITITATSFVANASSNHSGLYCTISTPPTITDPSNQIGLVPGSDDTIWVKPSNQTGGPGGRPIPVNIDINIVSSPPSSGPNFSLVPTDIQFSQRHGNGDQNGNANFNHSTPSGTTITVTNRWLHHGRRDQGNAPKWKFYIAVRDTVSGNMGWVDPGFENSEDN